METTATYRISGSGPESWMTAQRVTDLLGVEPTLSHEIGDPIVRRSGHFYGSSSWWLDSDRSRRGVELVDSLNEVLVQLEPVTAGLWELQDAGYSINWSCSIRQYPGEHMTELDRKTLTRLLALPGELWLDVYTNSEDPNWHFFDAT